MAVSIARETPLTPEIRVLISNLNADMKPLSPPEFHFQMTAEQMADEKTTVFIVRDEASIAIGMGALKRLGKDIGEVKRMYAAPEHRRKGIGRLVLSAVEARARELGLTQLKLETGATKGFEPAWALYERAGFTQCAAFADYPTSPYNRFYEKTL